MAKSIRKTPSNGAAKSLRETEKRIRAVSKQIEKTGRLRNPKTGAFVKATLPNIRKVEKEILRDVKQSKRTLKAASKFVDTIKGLFKDKKTSTTKGAVKPSSKRGIKPSTQSGSKKTSPTKNQKSSIVTLPGKSPTSKHAKPSVKSSRQRIYEVSELPQAFRTRTANATLEEMERDADDFNALLKPGDVFGGKVGYVNEHGHFVGGYTHNVYAKIEDYIQAISHYRVLEEDGDDEDKHVQTLDLLQIIRFKAPKRLVNVKGVPTLRQTQFAWGANRSVYNKKKAESKAAFKAKMVARDKQRAIDDARLRGQVSALEIEVKRLRAERNKK